MTTPWAEQLNEAMANLEKQKARVAQLQRELQQATASVTSKDRMVTVKVGPQGQVVALTFHTTDYRAMPPAQLSALLVDVLNEARARMGEQVIEAFKSFEGMGDALRLSLAGGTELDELLAPLRSMKPDTGGPAGTARSGRQEEFRG